MKTADEKTHIDRLAQITRKERARELDQLRRKVRILRAIFDLTQAGGQLPPH